MKSTLPIPFMELLPERKIHITDRTSSMLYSIYVENILKYKSMIPILNHIQYLLSQGELETLSHGSQLNTQLHFFTCGCVVIAEYSPDHNLYRHFTTPCDKHKGVLRDSNYSYSKIAGIMQGFNGMLQLTDGREVSTCLLADFIDANWLRMLPENRNNNAISQAEIKCILSLPVNEECVISTHAGHITVKRIS